MRAAVLALILALGGCASTPTHIDDVCAVFDQKGGWFNNWYKAAKRSDHFLEDPSEPPIFRARLADYRRSGYDRGHMAAAADQKQSQHAMDSTFLLSNMCPQVGDGFNRDVTIATPSRFIALLSVRRS